MTLIQRLTEVIQAIGADIKAINAGGGGGTTPNYSGVAYIDFSTPAKMQMSLTVYCDWVSSENSTIILTPNATGTVTNDSDEHLYGEFTLKPVNIVDNVSFDILMESTSKYGCVGEFKINWSVIN